MGAYQGLLTTQAGINIPRFKEGFLAGQGNPKTNASGSHECMQLPLRSEKSLSLVYGQASQADVSTSPNEIWIPVTLTGKFIYSGVDFLQNLMLLSQTRVQGFFSNLNGVFYNFVNNPGTYASPTGTEYFSLSYKHTIQQMKQAEVDITLKTTLTDNEANYLNDPTFSASYATGDTGGPTLGLVALASLTGASRSGFKTITVNGVSIGEIHNDTEQIIESTMMVPGNKGREYGRGAKVTLKAVGVQMNPVQMQGAIDHLKHADTYEVIATDYMGNAWTYVTGMKPDINGSKTGDDVGLLTVNMMTEYPYDFGTGKAIDFTSLTAPTFTQEGLY